MKPDITNIAPIQPGTRLISVVDWPKFHQFPSVAALRQIIFKEDENGASAWVRRIGFRVAIDEAAFFKWLEAQPKPTRKARVVIETEGPKAA